MTELEVVSDAVDAADQQSLWAEVRSSALLFLLALLTTGLAAVLIEFSARELG